MLVAHSRLAWCVGSGDTEAWGALWEGETCTVGLSCLCSTVWGGDAETLVLLGGLPGLPGSHKMWGWLGSCL